MLLLLSLLLVMSGGGGSSSRSGKGSLPYLYSNTIAFINRRGKLLQPSVVMLDILTEVKDVVILFH